MIAEHLFRHARFAAGPLRLRNELSVPELQRHFAEHGHAMVAEVFPRATSEAMRRAAAASHFDRFAPHPHALSAGAPSYMYYERRVPAHRFCLRTCAALCAFSRSMREGELLALVRAITGQRGHVPRSIRLRAYVKGSHVDRSVGERSGIDVSWYGSYFSTDRGGALRFGAAEPIVPRFGALHIREVRAGDVTSVTLVRGHESLFVLSTWMEESGEPAPE